MDSRRGGGRGAGAAKSGGGAGPQVAMDGRSPMDRHTIVLTQIVPGKPETRIYHDFERLDLALDGIIALYERRLRELNPDIEKIDYTIKDLFTYIDSLGDICILLLDPDSCKYDPFPREWVKQETYKHLAGMAAPDKAAAAAAKGKGKAKGGAAATGGH